MIQTKIFEADTRAEIEAQFNAWAASLATGAQMPGVGPTTRDGESFFKEVLYVLQPRNNGGIAVPRIDPRQVQRG